MRGYYRINAASIDVRQCPDARVNCSTTFGTESCHSASGCSGGIGNPCAENLMGTYCELCNRSGSVTVYYQPATSDAVAQCVACGDMLGQTFGVYVGALVGILGFVGVLLYARRRISEHRLERIRRTNAAYTPANKAKILLTYPDLHTGE
jgi:hypothetical protein